MKILYKQISNGNIGYCLYSGDTETFVLFLIVKSFSKVSIRRSLNEAVYMCLCRWTSLYESVCVRAYVRVQSAAWLNSLN